MIEEKLKLIREIENVVGYKKFKVSKKSTEAELDDVLSFICTSYDELEKFLSIIEKVEKHEITSNDAIRQVLDLYSVSGSLLNIIDDRIKKTEKASKSKINKKYKDFNEGQTYALTWLKLKIGGVEL